MIYTVQLHQLTLYYHNTSSVKPDRRHQLSQLNSNLLFQRLIVVHGASHSSCRFVAQELPQFCGVWTHKQQTVFNHQS
jgi:hypothetical protein